MREGDIEKYHKVMQGADIMRKERRNKEPENVDVSSLVKRVKTDLLDKIMAEFIKEADGYLTNDEVTAAGIHLNRALNRVLFKKP